MKRLIKNNDFMQKERKKNNFCENSRNAKENGRADEVDEDKYDDNDHHGDADVDAAAAAAVDDDDDDNDAGVDDDDAGEVEDGV